MVKAYSPHLGFSRWKEEQCGGGIPLLRPEEAGTYHIYSYIIGDNLVMVSSVYKEDWEMWPNYVPRNKGRWVLVGCFFSLLQPATLAAWFLCISFSHSSFLQDTEHTHVFHQGRQLKVPPCCYIQLKSHHSWVMFIFFTQVQRWLTWVRVDQIIETLI